MTNSGLAHDGGHVRSKGRISVAWRLSALGILPVALFVAFSIWMWVSLSAADRSLTLDVQKKHRSGAVGERHAAACRSGAAVPDRCFGDPGARWP